MTKAAPICRRFDGLKVDAQVLKKIKAAFTQKFKSFQT